SNTVATNCSGDASVGPLVSEDVERDGSTMEVTLLDNYVPKIGNCPHIFYSGHNHELTLHDGTTNFDSDIVLQIGGARQGHRWIGGLTRAGSNLTFNNNTPYPIVVESNISNSDIISCGSVDDNGSGTSVTIDSNCTQSCSDFDAYATIEAESYCDQSGTQTETTSDTGGGQNVGWINDGDWLRFDDVDFDNGAESVDVRVASSSSGGTVEFRLGSTSGTLLGTAVVPVTGGWQTWTTVSADISGASGTQDLYVVFAQGGININWFEFIAGTNPVGTNIALNGTATQSSTAYSGVASRAIDGNTSGNWSDGSVTHTSADTSNPWWEVDLGGTYDIDYIDIYNRTNCCSERLSNFTVSVIDGSTTTFSQTFASYPDPSISINTGGAIGDLVRVQINGTGTLSLAEVEVYGTSGTSCASFSTIQAEDFNNMSGVVDEGSNVGYIQDGDWVMYSNIDLTCAAGIDVRASSPTNGGNVEVRLGSSTGTLIGTVSVSTTGSWNNW
ncbi:MAG: carbohydrate-binding protein, partial [Marinoscillum sp.]